MSKRSGNRSTAAAKRRRRRHAARGVARDRLFVRVLSALWHGINPFLHSPRFYDAGLAPISAGALVALGDDGRVREAKPHRILDVDAVDIARVSED